MNCVPILIGLSRGYRRCRERRNARVLFGVIEDRLIASIILLFLSFRERQYQTSLDIVRRVCDTCAVIRFVQRLISANDDKFIVMHLVKEWKN